MSKNSLIFILLAGVLFSCNGFASRTGGKSGVQRGRRAVGFGGRRLQFNNLGQSRVVRTDNSQADENGDVEELQTRRVASNNGRNANQIFDFRRFDDRSTGFATLRKNCQGKDCEFKIGNDGKLGVVEFDLTGAERELFLDRFGILQGDVDPLTKGALRAFLAKNREKLTFPERADLFIAKQSNVAGAVGGEFIIDLDAAFPSGIVEAELKEAMRGKTPAQQIAIKRKWALGALNHLLSSFNIYTNRGLAGQFSDIKPDGTIRIKRLEGKLSREALAMLAAADPASRCNGGKIRLGRAIAALMGDGANYYNALGLSGLNRNQIYDRLGVETDQTRRYNNRALVTDPPVKIDPKTGELVANRKASPVAADDERIVGFLPQERRNGKMCFESSDRFERHATLEERQSRDPKVVGINYQTDAREVYCHLPNGIWFWMLFDKDGKLVNSAPSDIAGGGTTTGSHTTVTVGVSCMECHAPGVLFGGRRMDHPEEKYAETRNLILNRSTNFRVAVNDRFGRKQGEALNHRDFFVNNNKVYRDAGNFAEKSYLSTLRKIGADIKGKLGLWKGRTLPLVASYMDKQFSNVYLADMAREQHVTEKQMRAALGLGENDKVGLRRDEFDARFCDIRTALGKRQAGDNTAVARVPGEPLHFAPVQ